MTRRLLGTISAVANALGKRIRAIASRVSPTPTRNAAAVEAESSV